MKLMKKEKRKFGLLGRNISYSFSRDYFTRKFARLGLEDHVYVNFDLQDLNEFPDLISREKDLLGGLNVTIPYKEEVMQFLDEIDQEAALIGAVNTIKVLADGKLKGYNTDAFGFESSLKSCLRGDEKGALILGTGGASKAVAFVLQKLAIPYQYVSRSGKGSEAISYSELTGALVKEHEIIVNCTPLGTFPEVERKPEIPYSSITPRHLLFDLIYNPEKTAFLLEGKSRGARIQNGRRMLELQADKAWEIWNS